MFTTKVLHSNFTVCYSYCESLGASILKYIMINSNKLYNNEFKYSLSLSMSSHVHTYKSRQTACILNVRSYPIIVDIYRSRAIVLPVYVHAHVLYSMQHMCSIYTHCTHTHVHACIHTCTPIYQG